jgi:shikimate kinase
VKNIILIGFMGVGKTSVANALSKGGVRTKEKAASKDGTFRVIDTDAEIVQREKMTISEIFQKKGEAYFRELESGLLREYAAQQNLVISCGGGMALREENRKLMRECGNVVLLTAKPETILSRVGDAKGRPLLYGRTNRDSVAVLMEERRPAYFDAAQYIVSTDEKTPEMIAKEIMDIIKTPVLQ